MFIRILAAASLAFVTACATPVANYTPTSQAFSRPPLNTRATAAVGDEMLSQGVLTRREGIQVTSQSQLGGYVVTAGFFPLTGRDAQGAFYGFNYMSSAHADYGAISNNFLADPPQSLMTTPDGQLCVVSVFNVRVCGRHAFTAATRTTESSENFQQTLIYNGRVGDRVRIGYREFAGTLARPAFNNEVEYDLSVSNVIAYRGAQLRIIDANNTQITFEVLSNFNTPTPN